MVKEIGISYKTNITKIAKENFKFNLYKMILFLKKNFINIILTHS